MISKDTRPPLLTILTKGHYLVSLMFNKTNQHVNWAMDNNTEDEILCAIDEVNEIFFAENEIVQACEIAYSVEPLINVKNDSVNDKTVHSTTNKATEKKMAHKPSHTFNATSTARKLHLVFGHPTSKRLIEIRVYSAFSHLRGR